MLRILKLLVALVCVAMAVGCSSDDDPVTPPQPDVYTASANLHNFVVGDGQTNTQLSFRQGADINLANHIVPNGAAVNRQFLLDDPQQNSAVTFFQSLGDGTILNPGETFSLERDKQYVFMALGSIMTASGPLAPTLVQMDALELPPSGKVIFRITNALAGSPDPVDVHVNGIVVEGLAFGSHSSALEIDAREENQDEIVIVPAGETPNGSNEIWNSTGTTLFRQGLDYEAVLGHVATLGFNGNINGRTVLFLHEAQ